MDALPTGTPTQQRGVGRYTYLKEKKERDETVCKPMGNMWHE